MFVWDQPELRPVVAACAALTYAGDETLRKGRIIASRENGPDLPLYTAKVLQTLGGRPWIGLSKAWHLCTPLRLATTTVCCDATVGVASL